MIDYTEMILMGIWATLFMDFFALLLGELEIIRQLIGPEAVGRWILYMFRGKFIHADINQSPALSIEKSTTFLFHYLIGIALAGLYLLLESKIPAISHQSWMALIYGLATVLLPWLWLYPSLGLGLLASKAPRKSPYIITSLVNHTNFGLGMFLWILFFRQSC
jgi:hypothetical protein